MGGLLESAPPRREAWIERRCWGWWGGGGKGKGKQAGMAVQAAHLEADAFLVCLNHALSTEKEEVMGLCIGEVRAVAAGQVADLR